MADCKPDAFHSLDPQGGVSIPEVRKIIGEDIALIGNVNCGLLQTGTIEECAGISSVPCGKAWQQGEGMYFPPPTVCTRGWIWIVMR